MSAPVALIRAPAAAGGDGTLGTVPSTFQQTLILSRYQLRDYLRSRRFLLMVSIVVAAGVILTTLVAYYRPPGLIGSAGAFYGSLWAGGAGFLIVLAGIIFGGDAIAGEFQNRTGYFLMGLPVKRPAVYAGKYLAVLVASVVAMLLYLAIVIGNAAFYLGFGAFSDVGSLFASFLVALLYLLALMGFVFLFSSLFKTSLYAVLVVAILFLIGFSLIQEAVVGLTGTEPWYLLSYVAGIIAYPLTGVPAHIETVRVAGTVVKTYHPSYLEGFSVMFGYFLLTTIGGLLLFQREEFR